MHPQPLAYRDYEFLESEEARPLRILAEYLEPLRRFKAQVEKNWLIPQAAMSLRGRVVIQFYVLRNGTIVDIQVVQPSTVGAFTTAAAGALKLSNPTAQLPAEYPADRAFFTVTFHYNEGRDDRQ